jgi:hypothetical protein
MINTNEAEFAKLKGSATACRMCKAAQLPAPLRQWCKFCLGSGYVALCLPCNGSGKIGAEDVWGGKSVHRSTCNTCGGVGLIPARAPSEPVVEEGVVVMPDDSPDGTEVTESVKEAKDAQPIEQPKSEPPVPEGAKGPEVVSSSV